MDVSWSRLAAAAAVAAIALGALGLWAFVWRPRAEQAAREAQEQAREERLRAAQERVWAQQRSESDRWMPELLEGVEIGMAAEDLAAARPDASRTDGEVDPEAPELEQWEERLENGSRVVYAVDGETERLARVQVLSQLPQPEALQPHLAAMTRAYGAPSGIWECRGDDGISSFRFTWRGEQLSMADIVLAVPPRPAVTLYLAPTSVMAQSLERARCRAMQRGGPLAAPAAP
ncbi:MAG: hypothetical protein ACFCGT_09710 [Sandaracinaceae bacterium]